MAETIGTLTEAANRRGTATGTVTVTGWHKVIVFSGSTPVGDFIVNVGSTDPATYYAIDEAAVDWASVRNPTTTVALSGTTVKTATDVETKADTILARLGSWTGSGINTILGAFRALMAKAAALTPTDISSGTTFDNTTDSAEALRDNLLAPTVAGRTLDVSATGEAGVDWANVGSQSTVVALSGTTVKAVTDAITLPAIPTDWITADGIAADAIGSSELAASAVTEIQSGLATSANVSAVETDTQDIQSRIPAALAGGNMKSDVLAINNSTVAAAVQALMHAAVENGTAQAGGASSITLRAGASAVNDSFKYQAIWILSGTGGGQSNTITAYNGTTKVATVETAWVTQPDNTSVYVALGRVT